MSELPRGVPRGAEPAPRDSASAIVLDRTRDGWEILLGLRSRRSRFMPGHLACPGGTTEPGDDRGESDAYRCCASRELLEETGIDIAPPDWIEAGERVTPPVFPVRFRTRFFVAELPDGPRASGLAPASGENESLRLARPDSVLLEWKRGVVQLPPPILPILRTLSEADGEPLGEVGRRLVAANAQEERAPRIEFLPDVWMLPVRTATLPPATHTNVWMPGGRRFVLIDPGSDVEAENARLAEVVSRRRSLGHEPVGVWLTHHHQDHVAGVAETCRRLALPLCAHEATLAALGRAVEGIECRPITDGAALDLDGLVLQALHTPGHADGHLAFHARDRRWLIGGDLASGLSTILIDPDHGDMDAYLASLDRADRLGCRLVLPGHGPPLPGSALRALIEHRGDRESRIIEAIGDGVTQLAEIALAAYADTPGLPPRLIETQTRAHLLRLERRGEAERIDAAGANWRGIWGAS